MELASPCGCVFLYCEACARDDRAELRSGEPGFLPVAEWVRKLSQRHRRPTHAELVAKVADWDLDPEEYGKVLMELMEDTQRAWGSRTTGPYCGIYGPCPMTWREIEEGRLRGARRAP